MQRDPNLRTALLVALMVVMTLLSGPSAANAQETTTTADPTDVQVVAITEDALRPLLTTVALGFGLVTMLLSAQLIGDLGRKR